MPLASGCCTDYLAAVFASRGRQPDVMERDREQADLPTEQPPAGQDPRFPAAHAYPCRSRDPAGPSPEGPQRALGVKPDSCVASCSSSAVPVGLHCGDAPGPPHSLRWPSRVSTRRFLGGSQPGRAGGRQIRRWQRRQAPGLTSAACPTQRATGSIACRFPCRGACIARHCRGIVCRTRPRPGPRISASRR
jgi:hypothetical protein